MAAAGCPDGSYGGGGFCAEVEPVASALEEGRGDCEGVAVAVTWPFLLGSRLMVYMAGPLLCLDNLKPSYGAIAAG
jgi:hypothetical protein